MITKHAWIWSEKVKKKKIKQTNPVPENVYFLKPNEHVLYSISKLPTPFWKIIYASYIKLSKELKNGIAILVGQVVFKLWIKDKSKCCLDQ